MSWWLEASAEELDQARTCSGCGSKDADIDLNLCFDCWCKIGHRDRCERTAVIAARYGNEEQAAFWRAKAEEPEYGEKSSR